MSDVGITDSQSSNFSISLFQVGAEGAIYRVQNASGEFQRQHIIDRDADFMVQCNLVNVIHGIFSPGGDEATVIVIEFRFHSTKNGRQFREANIEILFKGAIDNMADGDSDPEVVEILPKGKWVLDPTYEARKLERDGGMGGRARGGIGELEVHVSRRETISSVKESRASVTGAIRIEGRNFGATNLAKWTMLENSSDANTDGIPTVLRAAILLKRKCGGYFKATVKIKTKVDARNSVYNKLEDLLGMTPKDDPVLFNPSLPPEEDVPADMDIGNLSSYDLERLSKVESMGYIRDVAAGTAPSYIPVTDIFC